MAMFPYRPRKPVYGGKLAKKKDAEAEAEAAALPKATSGRKKARKKKPNPLAQLRDGGPIERALKSDLISLRKGFVATVVDSEVSQVQGAREHYSRGSNFLLFKDAFRRGKFGIVHTRCMPPRCDRAEYAQILYSACLGLLAESVRVMEESEEEEDASERGVSETHLLDAAFAVFALYALYETNPLPSFPPLRPKASSHPSFSHDGSLSEEDKAALTLLPLGLTAAGEQSRVIHRRAYRSPIRIGRDSYMNLVCMRDACLEQVSCCEDRRMEAVAEAVKEKQGRIMNHDGQTAESSWCCKCSMAQDCIQVIDRLQTNYCFDFCEYAGPSSLEGLTGSSDYYRNVVDVSASSINRPPESTSLFDKEDLDKCAEVDVKSALELDSLQQAFSRYHASLDTIALHPPKDPERILGRRGQQSNQALLMQQSLMPILCGRQTRLAQSEICVRSRTIETLEVICDNLKGDAREEHGDWNEFYINLGNESEHPEAAREDGKNAGKTLKASSTDSIFHGGSAALEPSAQTYGASEKVVRFVLPPGTSRSLEKAIRAACCGIGDELRMRITPGPSRTMISSGADRQDTRTPTKQSNAADFPSRDDLEVLSELGIENEAIVSGNEDEEPSFLMQGDEYGEVESVMSHESRKSTALVGRAALQQLLSYAATSEETEGMPSGKSTSHSSGGQQQSLLVQNPIGTEHRKSQTSSGDDVSKMPASPSSGGAGQSALHLLLSSAGSPDGSREAKMGTASPDSTKNTSRQPQHKKRLQQYHDQKPSGTKRRRAQTKFQRLESDGEDTAKDISSDDASMASEPSSGVGQNALHLLLSSVHS